MLRFRHLWHRQEGQAAIFMGIAATAIMGLVALGVDVGRLYHIKARLTAAADAAALAGVTALPGYPDLARDLAVQYLQQNGVAPAEAAVTVSADLHRLRVRVTRQEPMTFAVLLGFQNRTVVTEVEAAKQNLSGVRGAIPLGVPEGEFAFGKRVVLKRGSGQGPLTPGNFQALALGGHRGAAHYEYDMKYGYPSWVRIGDELDTEPGNMAGPTRRAVAYRISQDPHATWQTVTRNSPRVVTVPVLSRYPNGRGKVEVVAFAVFFLEEPEPGESDAVVGRFLEWIVDGEQADDAPNYGAWGIRLSR